MAAPVRRGSGGFQLGSHVKMIIDLTVERDRQPPAIAAHRLRAGLRQLDDGEPPVSESNASRSIGPETGSIGTTMHQRLCHVPRNGREAALIAPTRPE